MKIKKKILKSVTGKSARKAIENNTWLTYSEIPSLLK